MIAFGGQANTDLAVTCADPGRLADAYMAPIARYGVTTIDLDLEGQSLADVAADAPRALATWSRGAV
jgi:chitinase